MKFLITPLVAVILCLSIGFGINYYFQTSELQQRGTPLQQPVEFIDTVSAPENPNTTPVVPRAEPIEADEAPTYSFTDENATDALPDEDSAPFDKAVQDIPEDLPPSDTVLQAIADQEADATDALQQAILSTPAAMDSTAMESAITDSVSAAIPADNSTTPVINGDETGVADNHQLVLDDGYVVLPDKATEQLPQITRADSAKPSGAKAPPQMNHDVSADDTGVKQQPDPQDRSGHAVHTQERVLAAGPLAGNPAQSTMPETADEDIQEESLPDAQVDYYWGLRSYYFDDLESDDDAFEIDSTKLFSGMVFNKPIAEDWLLEGDIRANYEWRHLYTDGENETGPSLALKELLIRKELLFDSPYWSMMLGRTRLTSQRGWLMEDEMDVLQFNYNSTLLDFNIGHARWLWDGIIGTGIDRFNDDQRLETSGTKLLFANLQYQWQKGHYIQADYHYEDFENPRNIPANEVRRNNVLNRESQLHWLKFSAFGNEVGEVTEQEYWVDVALSSGDKKELQLQDGFVTGLKDNEVDKQWAIQAGFLHKNHVRGLGFGVSAAFSPKDAGISGFSQPVTAGNKKRLFGQVNRRYYGELAAPRLENLAVISVHGGWQIDEDLWLELSLHRYHQHHPDRESFHSRLGIPLNGQSKYIGHNLEAVFGGKVSTNSTLELLASVFWAGSAYDGTAINDRSYRVQLQWRGWW